MVLQGGDESEQFSAAGAVTMAKHDGGCAPKSWEEPAFPGLLPQDGELHGVRAAGETFQINFGASAFRFDNAIDKESGYACGGEDGEKYERQNSGDKSGVPACGIT